MDVSFSQHSGTDILPFLDELGELRITVFREFPYIYDGDLDYERNYLKTYALSDRSLLVLVRDGAKLIGASTALPLADGEDDFKNAFRETDYNIDNIMYFGESIVLPPYRGNLIGTNFFHLREGHAQMVLPSLEATTFCAVDRPVDHPLKPEGYQVLDHFWDRMGYERQDDMQVHYPWKDIGDEHETKKSMTFWLKSWS